MADAIHENVNNLLNLHISLASHRTNEVMGVLTIFSVFFLPLTFIVGLYGMNFDYMPELHHEMSYPVVVGIMLLIVILTYIWFKRKNWI
jgi:magnesium transporter